jgi:membrane fusion protein (multidrug efflux system)
MCAASKRRRRRRDQDRHAQAQEGPAQISEAAAAQGSARPTSASPASSPPLPAPLAPRRSGWPVVQPGQRLLTLVPTQAIYVEANYKETQIGLMRPGQPVTMEVDALPDVDFHGVVASITPGTGANFSLIPPQNATGNFTKIVQRAGAHPHQRRTETRKCWSPACR